MFALERLNSIDELAARISAVADPDCDVSIHKIKSTGDLRGYSVRQEVEALPSRYEHGGHVIVLCTHAALLMSDLRGFVGWHVVIDEVPNVLVMQEVCSKLDVSFFRTNYALSDIDGKWSRVSLTEAGRLIDGSDLQQDDSHRHLRLFHQRVADSERGERAVICNLRRWQDMEEPHVQWTWWSLFSVRQLEAFESVLFLGNGFMETVSAKMMQRWDSDVIWKSRSTTGDRPLVSRCVTIHYFSPERRSSKSFFGSDKGQRHLEAIGLRIATEMPLGRFIWSSNEVAAPPLRQHLRDSARLSPRQAGSDKWMHCTHAAMLYAAKPSPNVRAILEALGVEGEEWIATNEWETILQFVTRTSIRDVTSAEAAVVYVYDKAQAEYLLRFFDTQTHIQAEAEFVDLGLDFSEEKPGPKVRSLTPEEAALRASERRRKKAEYERSRRARLKAAE